VNDNINSEIFNELHAKGLQQLLSVLTLEGFMFFLLCSPTFGDSLGKGRKWGWCFYEKKCSFLTLLLFRVFLHIPQRSLV